jgi:hypothetical protein
MVANPEQTAIVIKNARHLKNIGELRRPGGYIHDAIERGFAPIPEAAKAEADAIRAAQARAQADQDEQERRAIREMADDELNELIAQAVPTLPLVVQQTQLSGYPDRADALEVRALRRAILALGAESKVGVANV